MKINQGLPAQGSFGLPPQMRDSIDEFKKRKFEDPLPEASDDPEPVRHEFSEDLGVGGPMPEAMKADGDDEEDVSPSPIERLAKIGVVLSDDDFHKIIFKGYLEKDIVVVPSIRGTKPFVATFKTMTGAEMDEADELLAEDIGETRMTNEGYQMRRSMWFVCYGVVKLMGKPVCQPVVDSKTGISNTKATAQAKRRVLSALSPAVLSKIMFIHATFIGSINGIIADPEADYLKK